MIYKCETCKTVFDRKYVYEKHINRKTPCTRVVEPDPDAEFTCIHCGRSFSRKDVLTRHYTTCKMRNSKYSLSKIQKANVLENINQAAIDSYNTNTTNNTTNNVTNNTHIHIHLPEITTYDRQSISDMMHFIMNSEELKDDLYRLTSKISNYIKKNKPTKIFQVALTFIHNNVLIPQGKNIFLGKGPLKDQFISKQPNGWSRTQFIRVVQTSVFILIRLMKLINIDPEDPNSKLCLEALNDSKNIASLFGEVIENVMAEFDHSKKPPDIGELSTTIARGEDLTKMLIIPELEKLYDSIASNTSNTSNTPNTSNINDVSTADFKTPENSDSESSCSFETYVRNKKEEFRKRDMMNKEKKCVDEESE